MSPPHPFVVLIYGGSRSGNDAEYTRQYTEFCAGLAEQEGIALVNGAGYGRGTLGNMGIPAAEFLKRDRTVIGVTIPSLYEREGYPVCTVDGVQRSPKHMYIVNAQRVETALHFRVSAMRDIADMVLTARGGFGTREEWNNDLTHGQLGVKGAEVNFLNFRGGFDNDLKSVRADMRAGFADPNLMSLITVLDAPDQALRFVRQRHEEWLASPRARATGPFDPAHRFHPEYSHLIQRVQPNGNGVSLRTALGGKPAPQPVEQPRP